MGLPPLLFLLRSSVINALNQPEERAVPAVDPSHGANEEPPSVSESGRRRVLHAEYSRGSLLCVHLVRGTGGVSKCDILGAVMVPGTNVS